MRTSLQRTSSKNAVREPDRRTVSSPPPAVAPLQRKPDLPNDDAARLAHNFRDVAVGTAPVRRGIGGLPLGLKAGIENISGVAMDDVRVHYNSSRPAQLQALAYTQGSDIHIRPGQERHLPHEAWHVVQQKQGRVRPTMRMKGSAINDSMDLEREADLMGAKALRQGPSSRDGASSALRAQGPRGKASGAPVQMWPEWLDKLRGKKKSNDESAALSPQDQAANNFLTQIHENERQERRQQERSTRNYIPDQHIATVAAPRETKVKSALSPLSGVLSVGAKTADTISQTSSALKSGGLLGVGSSAIGAPASLLDAAVNMKNVVTGGDQKKDKALMMGQAVSSLGSATTTTASGILKGAKAGLSGFSKASSLASTVAGPAALVTGATDIVRGTVGGGLALHRRQKLAAMHGDMDEAMVNSMGQEGGEYRGIVRFAKESQTTKAVRGFGTAIGGGLAVAGGLGLMGLALSNPVGWGLLGGAAAIGGGLALYKKYRQHQQGKKIKNDLEYRMQLNHAGIHVPDDGDLKLTGAKAHLKNLFTTKEIRRHDMVRGQIADELANREHKNDSMNSNIHVPRILGNIGIASKPRSYDDRSHLLESNNQVEDEVKKRKRAKDIARVLEG